jgi:hypothetical protein
MNSSYDTKFSYRYHFVKVIKHSNIDLLAYECTKHCSAVAVVLRLQYGRQIFDKKCFVG